jgi:hypothetical protein
MNDALVPMLGAEVIRRAMHKELSTTARVSYILLLLVGLGSALLIGSLWLTEPRPLPLRTQVAFGMLVAVNLAWATLSAWVLAQRKVLYVQHKIIGAWMAIVFCAAFLLLGMGIAYQRGNTTALIILTMGGIAQLIVAVVLLARARRQRSELLARREELQRQLAVG